MKLTLGLTGVALGIACSIACGSSPGNDVFHGGGTQTGSGASTSGGASASGGTSGSSAGYTFSTGNSVGTFTTADDGGAAPASDGGIVSCDDAGHCTCSDGNATTIEGYVYDPAGKNPLYNVTVFVPDPASPLPNLDSVPVECGCTQFYPSSVLAVSAPTDPSGHFSIPCAPSGTVSLVVQTGKWRMRFDGFGITPNVPNMVPNLRLPRNSTEGSLPNIAISTGAADSLECLPLRIGVSPSEYVMGSSTGGHIHIYTGFNGAVTSQGSVESTSALWDSEAHLMEHDVVLLSCEGQETTGGNPGAQVANSGANGAQGFLLNYANSGGRVFASHFHYAWFNTGPFNVAPGPIAMWNTNAQSIDDTTSFASDVDTTLASGAVFPEGAALQAWLGGVGALTNNQLPIWFARHNVQALVQPPSTEWIHLDANITDPNANVQRDRSAPQYFSVDTPIGASAEATCGRVVYSDLHVSGGPGMNIPNVPPDYPGNMLQGGVAPSQCASHPLTPQEDALEFMLFDLSSCLVPVGQTAPPPPHVAPR